MRVEIRVLGGFEVVVDKEPVADAAWRRRHAALLVKCLALAPGHRLHREQLIDALWPDLTLDEAGPRLHKAAHFARKALGVPDGVVLDGETVALLPDAEVEVDAEIFEEAAGRARAEDATSEALEAALDVYGGPLLPDDPYEEWTDALRGRLELTYLELLRRAGRWEQLVAADPADEEAHLALMQAHIVAGDRRAALRQFERMDKVLRRELGVGPSAAALALRDQLLEMAPEMPSIPSAADDGLVGRSTETACLREVLDAAAAGRGATVLVTGPPGMGKSALLDWLRRQAPGQVWRCGSGEAAALEGSWPYAPVLEAVAELCRDDPALLAGLPGHFRDEIDRALSGRELDWTGDSSHQRLFVATAELIRLAAGDRPVLLVLDDLHEADEASLRLVHYLARSLRDERVVLALSHRPMPVPEELHRIRQSLLDRHAAIELALAPLDRERTAALVGRQLGDPSRELVEQVHAVSGGVPFAVVELARRAGDEPAGFDPLGADVVGGLAPKTREVLQRVAVVGTAFDTDQFVALSSLPEDEAFAQLDAALAAQVVTSAQTGYQFRHQLVREALLRELAPHHRRVVHRDAARRLEQLGASPMQVAHHLLEAGEHSAAIPFVVRAARAEAALGAFRDALDSVESVLPHAAGDDRARLLSLRADLLAALGDRHAIHAYRQALEVAPTADRPLVRARMARAAVMAGDTSTGREIIDGLQPDGGPHDPAILLAQGLVAYFSGDLDGADAAAGRARALVPQGESWQILDLVGLQGLIAHDRGEWFERLRHELQATQDEPDLAISVFDSHLCVAEYLLYGPTPYDEVISLADSLRQTAGQAGVLRAVAFAGAVVGEAALLSGDLARAERELQEAVDVHRDLGATAGEAHSLQRLAEVRLLQGDRDEARRLLRAALPLARWSLIPLHLMQRIYGTLIRAAEDAEAARAVVDEAEATLGDEDVCPFCDIMLVVPATIACADVGDLERAATYLARAEDAGTRWPGTAWQAAILEAQAHQARAERRREEADTLLTRAADLFERAGQPLDAARCQA